MDTHPEIIRRRKLGFSINACTWNYDIRDKFKELGAWWDPEHKRWLFADEKKWKEAKKWDDCAGDDYGQMMQEAGFDEYF